MIQRLRHSRLYVGAAFAAALPVAPRALAQWQPDGAPVCVAAGDQTKSVVVADGNGGAFVVWEDHRGADPQIYAQHLNALGVPLWGTNGMLVSSGSWPQYGPVAVGDSEGGIYIAWILSLVVGAYEGRGQRLASNGTPYWSGGGIPLTPGVALPTKLAIINDGRIPIGVESAGIILAWTDLRPSTSTDIYIQATSGTGALRWGTAVCTATGNQTDVCMATDGFANLQGFPRGAVVAWRDYRAGVQDPDIFVQRINYAGTPVWTANGVNLAPGITPVLEPAIVPAGSQNAIVCWPGPVPGRQYGMFANREGAAGSWGAAIALTDPSGGQTDQAVRSDFAGGIIAVWEHPGPNLARDIYAQRLDATGARLWGTAGKPVSTNPTPEDSPVIVAGLSGASVVAWLDARHEVNRDIFAQLLDLNGARQWPAEGVPICRATGMQTELAACPETSGGAIVAWTDYRNGNADIYAQRVKSTGAVTDVEFAQGSTLSLSRAWPTPSPAGVTLSFDLPAASAVSAAVFDAAGRRVRTLLAGETYSTGHHTLEWDGKSEGGRIAAHGVYWIAVSANGAQASRRAVILR